MAHCMVVTGRTPVKVKIAGDHRVEGVDARCRAGHRYRRSIPRPRACSAPTAGRPAPGASKRRRCGGGLTPRRALRNFMEDHPAVRRRRPRGTRVGYARRAHRAGRVPVLLGWRRLLVPPRRRDSPDPLARLERRDVRYLSVRRSPALEIDFYVRRPAVS